ncbi:AT hook motif family protein [Trichomonas vaginalis G3]|uniref:AT hook motif family protein n=1 Tax=Trichomonas vaginalis (strain ATCC PRA-98 / G3) TaxID=412133 RepID=A2FF91_TRIV3|nr:quinoprotein alcohol dehydrogenase-like family [Trichomonas vaginalis G3]EAX96421.1 AT hook motif family protein [Trichomonas vaginalis G3]KAI5501887.1 quinoprotein alcohol dehydrogenase-like family [Trichomonas vaginalis G3]|eukprot:XP_001309351.1 AT hook motif family protein [Trichomonas vaginalis G3]
MLSSQDVLELQQVDDDDFDLIHPILLSTFTSTQNEVGMEVIPIPSTIISRPNQSRSKTRFNIVDPEDKKIWYQIKSDENRYFLLKLKDNKNLWDQALQIAAPASCACICGSTIVVALEDGSIHFVDKNFGCFCIPSILMQGKALHLKAIDNDKVVCINSLKKVSVWNLESGSRITKIFDETYSNDMPAIDHVDLTKELPNGELSPIIFFKDYSVRWSHSMNYWVCNKPDIPPYFEVKYEHETVADIENDFTDALLYYETDKVIPLFKELLAFYLKDTPEKAITLTLQLFLRFGEYFDSYCDISISELLTIASTMIEEKSSDLLQQITQSKQYEMARKAKDATEKPRLIFKGKLSTSNLEDEEMPQSELESVAAERAKYSYTPQENRSAMYASQISILPLPDLLKNLTLVQANYITVTNAIKQVYANPDKTNYNVYMFQLSQQYSQIIQQIQYYNNLKNMHIARISKLDFYTAADEFNKLNDYESKMLYLQNNALLNFKYQEMKKHQQDASSQNAQTGKEDENPENDDAEISENDEVKLQIDGDLTPKSKQKGKQLTIDSMIAKSPNLAQAQIPTNQNYLMANLPKKRGRPRKNPLPPPIPSPTKPIPQITQTMQTQQSQSQEKEEEKSNEQNKEETNSQQSSQSQPVQTSPILTPEQLVQYQNYCNIWGAQIRRIQELLTRLKQKPTQEHLQIYQQYQYACTILRNHYQAVQQQQQQNQQIQQIQQEEQKQEIPEQRIELSQDQLDEIKRAMYEGTATQEQIQTYQKYISQMARDQIKETESTKQKKKPGRRERVNIPRDNSNNAPKKRGRKKKTEVVKEETNEEESAEETNKSQNDEIQKENSEEETAEEMEQPTQTIRKSPRKPKRRHFLSSESESGKSQDENEEEEEEEEKKDEKVDKDDDSDHHEDFIDNRNMDKNDLDLFGDDNILKFM